MTTNVFLPVKKGADFISGRAVVAHDLHRQGDRDAAKEVAESIVAECATLLQRAQQAVRSLSESFSLQDLVDSGGFQDAP